ncbi:MAG: hypothetical protein HYV06_03685, partial [Deltaproteobacteria bacterium]|nr:hypothetical protein [Deltaproteobacteria bacterium]
MKHQKGQFAEIGKPHPRSGAIDQVILDLLQSRDMRPGDSINIILAQYEVEQRGFNTVDFSTGVVQLLERGLLDMQGNVFYLTGAGFEALRRDRRGGYA